MTKRLKAAFLDFATLGPGVDTAPLDALADVAYYTSTPLEQAAERLDGMDIAIVNKARIDADAIERSDQLKLIVLAATGSDNGSTVSSRGELDRTSTVGVRLAAVPPPSSSSTPPFSLTT